MAGSANISALLERLRPKAVLRACLDKILICTSGSVYECYNEKYSAKYTVRVKVIDLTDGECFESSQVYSAIWTRDDSVLLDMHKLMVFLGLPTMLEHGADLGLISTKWQTTNLLGNKSVLNLDNCNLSIFSGCDDCDVFPVCKCSIGVVKMGAAGLHQICTWCTRNWRLGRVLFASYEYCDEL